MQMNIVRPRSVYRLHLLIASSQFAEEVSDGAMVRWCNGNILKVIHIIDCHNNKRMNKKTEEAIHKYRTESTHAD